MTKTEEEARELHEDMATNNYQWPSDRVVSKKVVGMHCITPNYTPTVL